MNNRAQLTLILPSYRHTIGDWLLAPASAPLLLVSNDGRSIPGLMLPDPEGASDHGSS